MDRNRREWYEILAVGQTGKWGDIRFYRNADGNTEYLCCHMEYDADLSDIHWHIWKHTYDGVDVSRVAYKVGSVDDRETLF